MLGLIKDNIRDANLEILIKQEIQGCDKLFTGIRIDTLNKMATIYVNALLSVENNGFSLFVAQSKNNYIDVGVNI